MSVEFVFLKCPVGSSFDLPAQTHIRDWLIVGTRPYLRDSGALVLRMRPRAAGADSLSFPILPTIFAKLEQETFKLSVTILGRKSVYGYLLRVVGRSHGLPVAF